MSRETSEQETDGPSDRGPKYFVDVEGTEYEWDKDTISVPEIRELAGLASTDQVVEIDRDQNERTLTEDAVVELKPGHGFSKKRKFKRGNDDWIGPNLELLRTAYESVEHLAEGDWVRVGPARLNATGWTPGEVYVAFQIPPRGQAPYGLHVSPPVARTDGAAIGNYEAATTTPFGGTWGKFSWQPEVWVPGAELASGANMLMFARSLSARLDEGAA